MRAAPTAIGALRQYASRLRLLAPCANTPTQGGYCAVGGNTPPQWTDGNAFIFRFAEL